MGEDFVGVSPDSGGIERVRAFAKQIHCPIAVIDKRRTGPNEAKAAHLVGDVKNKTAIILDDMIDTAGTLTQAVDSLLNNGAKRVIALASHPIFSGPAIERIEASGLQKVFVSDTIPLSEAAGSCPKIEVVSVVPVVAEAIKRINSYDSVSALFDGSLAGI